MEILSIIVPCYNEEEVLPIFYKETTEVLKNMDVDYEIIYVDDGSKDKTSKIIKEFAENDPHSKYIIFSRNFGKEAAMYAGLKNSIGDYVVIMDADLQDPPHLLPEMLNELRSGEYDCIGSRRVTRKGEPKIRSFFARQFYKIINKLSNIEIVDGARDFQMMKRSMTDAVLDMPEVNRFSKGIFSWVGFKKKWLEYENIERKAGETKWNFWKLFKYSMEGIVAFSTKPLSLMFILGIFLCLAAFIAIIVIILRSIFGDYDIGNGWASIVCIVTFIGGLNLFSMGIIGQYLAKTYLETKNRPIYIAKEKNTTK
jgi:glycosyltransferase involved in cell wall biosynthesis